MLLWQAGWASEQHLGQLGPVEVVLPTELGPSLQLSSARNCSRKMKPKLARVVRNASRHANCRAAVYALTREVFTLFILDVHHVHQPLQSQHTSAFWKGRNCYPVRQKSDISRVTREGEVVTHLELINDFTTDHHFILHFNCSWGFFCIFYSFCLWSLSSE